MAEQTANTPSPYDGWHLIGCFLVVALGCILVTGIGTSLRKAPEMDAKIAATVSHLSQKGGRFMYQNQEYEVVDLEGDVLVFKEPGSDSKQFLRGTFASIASECVYQAGGSAIVEPDRGGNLLPARTLDRLCQEVKRYLGFSV